MNLHSVTVISMLSVAILSCTNRSAEIGDSTNTKLGKKSSQASAAISYGGVLKITAPGHYTGNYSSPDTNPAIEVNTAGTVYIENCNITGKGDLIQAWWGTNLIIRNCNGYGQGTDPGKFLGSSGLHSLEMTNNYLENVSKGALVYSFQGNSSLGETVKITNNIARNIRSVSDRGGFIQFNRVPNIVGAEIAFNQVVNEPGVSKVEDNINLFNSYGTAASPIRIHDNYIQGAYPETYGVNYSGTGMTSDGDGTLSEMPAYIEAYNNSFVSNCNSGMNMAGGHHIRYHDNRIISSSMKPDGSGEMPLGCTWTGTSAWNNFSLPAGSPYFSNNSIDNNIIGYVRKGITNPFPDRQDIYICENGFCSNNTSLPNTITLDSEKAEWKLWNTKLIQNNRTAGSSDHSNNGSTSIGSGSNIFFGPANGTAAAPVPTSGTWSIVGYENDTIVVPANSTVRWGANGMFVIKVVSGSFVATNGFFGSDPVPGVRKEVDLLQQASATAAGVNYGVLVAQFSGKCIDIIGGSTATSAGVIQNDCGNQASEQFKFVATNIAGAYNIVNMNSGQCLNVESSSTADGARVQQYTCGDWSDQKFTLSPAANGYYSLVALHSGKCLDVSGISTLSGALVHQWTCGGGGNQLWKVDAASLGAPASPAPATPTPAPVLGFLRAINLNGAAFTMENHTWQAGSTAPNLIITGGTPFSNQNVTLSPAVSSASKASMIRSSVYGSNMKIELGGLTPAKYQVYLYVWEDNAPATYSVKVEGTQVLSNFNSGSAGAWRKLGPYPAIVNDGALTLQFNGGDANLSGVEVWKQQ